MVFKPGYCEGMLRRIFGLEQNMPHAALEQVHFDLLLLQAMTERVVFHLLDYLRTQTLKILSRWRRFQNSVLNGKSCVQFV